MKKRKILRETTQGGHLSGIVSPRSPDIRFHCLGRKLGFGTKFRELKRTFFLEKLGLRGLPLSGHDEEA